VKVKKITPEERAKLIEDRRSENPVLRPSQPGTLFYGLPVTPHEQKLYQLKLEAERAFKAGLPPPPQPGGTFTGDPVPVTNADPYGIEARRTMAAELAAKKAAIQARVDQDMKILAELDARIAAATRTEKAPKR
jgi:hypothetical protein